ncbi:MAG: PRC-barrel domain-containing protein [Hasllibacter sp.]
MLTSLTALLESEVTTPDGGYRVAAAWMDPAAARLVYLEVETGGMLSRGRALIHASRIAAGDPPRADVTAAQIEAAETEPEGGFLLDPADLPAILTGPFGNTISPLLMMAGLRSEAEEEAPPHREGAPAAPPPDPREALEPARDWIGAPVFGRDGELGRVEDVMLALADLTTAHLIVSDGSGRHAVPWAAVRRRAEGGHIVIAGDAATLAASPDVPVPSDLSPADAAAILRHWDAEPQAPPAPL